MADNYTVLSALFRNNMFMHNQQTPMSAMEDMVRRVSITPTDKIFVMHSVEFLVYLTQECYVPRRNILFYSGGDGQKDKCAFKLKIQTKSNLANCFKPVDVIIGHVPYTAPKAKDGDPKARWITELRDIKKFMKPNTRWCFLGPTKDGQTSAGAHDPNNYISTLLNEYGWSGMRNDPEKWFGTKTKIHASIFSGRCDNQNKKILLETGDESYEFPHDFLVVAAEKPTSIVTIKNSIIVNKYFDFPKKHDLVKLRTPPDCEYLHVRRVSVRGDPQHASLNKNVKFLQLDHNTCEKLEKTGGQFIVNPTNSDDYIKTISCWSISKFVWHNVFSMTPYYPVCVPSRLPDLREFSSSVAAQKGIGLTDDEINYVEMWELNA